MTSRIPRDIVSHFVFEEFVTWRRECNWNNDKRFKKMYMIIGYMAFTFLYSTWLPFPFLPTSERALWPEPWGPLRSPSIAGGHCPPPWTLTLTREAQLWSFFHTGLIRMPLSEETKGCTARNYLQKWRGELRASPASPLRSAHLNTPSHATCPALRPHLHGSSGPVCRSLPPPVLNPHPAYTSPSPLLPNPQSLSIRPWSSKILQNFHLFSDGFLNFSLTKNHTLHDATVLCTQLKCGMFPKSTHRCAWGSSERPLASA